MPFTPAIYCGTQCGMPTPDTLRQRDPLRQEPEHCMGKRCTEFTPDCPATLKPSYQLKLMTDWRLCFAREPLPSRSQTPNPKPPEPGI